MAKIRNNKHDGLNERQKRFCEEYLKDLNANDAAIRAGYSKKTARFIGSENLTKPNIKLRIKELMDKRSKRVEITADRVLQELAKLGFADLKDFMSWDNDKMTLKNSDTVDGAVVCEIAFLETEIPQKGGDPITKLQKKIKLYNKVDALKSIGEHLGMFDKKESSLSEEDTKTLLEASVILIKENL